MASGYLGPQNIFKIFFTWSFLIHFSPLKFNAIQQKTTTNFMILLVEDFLAKDPDKKYYITNFSRFHIFDLDISICNGRTPPHTHTHILEN